MSDMLKPSGRMHVAPDTLAIHATAPRRTAGAACEYCRLRTQPKMNDVWAVSTTWMALPGAVEVTDTSEALASSQRTSATFPSAILAVSASTRFLFATYLALARASASRVFDVERWYRCAPANAAASTVACSSFAVV
jgi:hypothetical protein